MCEATLGESDRRHTKAWVGKAEAEARAALGTRFEGCCAAIVSGTLVLHGSGQLAPML